MKGLMTVAAGLVLAAAIPLAAHHSIDAEYDRSKPVTVTGTVTKVEWMNPHIWYYVDAKDASGKVVKWQFEGGPPNALRRQGWKRDSLKPGDMVTVQAVMAKDGSNTANTSTVRLADGRVVLGRAPSDEAQGKAK